MVTEEHRFPASQEKTGDVPPTPGPPAAWRVGQELMRCLFLRAECFPFGHSPRSSSHFRSDLGRPQVCNPRCPETSICFWSRAWTGPTRVSAGLLMTTRWRPKVEDWLEARWWGPRGEEGVPCSAGPRPGLQDLVLRHIPQPRDPGGGGLYLSSLYQSLMGQRIWGSRSRRGISLTKPWAFSDSGQLSPWLFPP